MLSVMCKHTSGPSLELDLLCLNDSFKIYNNEKHFGFYVLHLLVLFKKEKKKKKTVKMVKQVELLTVATPFYINNQSKDVFMLW